MYNRSRGEFPEEALSTNGLGMTSLRPLRERFNTGFSLVKAIPFYYHPVKDEIRQSELADLNIAGLMV